MAALSDDHDTVRVATGSGPGEAAVFRAVLSAHGIEAIMPEGGTTAGFYDTSFPVFVARGRAEEAAALIAEIRAGATSDAPHDDADDADGADDPDAAFDEDVNRALAQAPDVGRSVERRRRVGVTLLVAIIVGFGTGHMSTGAWKRGVALAAIEIVGLRHLAAGNKLGVVLVIGAVLADVVGAMLHIRARNASVLPVARLRESRSRDRR